MSVQYEFCFLFGVILMLFFYFEVKLLFKDKWVVSRIGNDLLENVAISSEVAPQRYITIKEILANASVIRAEYFSNLHYPFVAYSKGDPICNTSIESIPQTTDVLRKRNFMTLNHKNPILWNTFLGKKRKEAQAPEFLRSTYGWFYSENVCLDNDTNRVHIYTTDANHYAYLNSSVHSIKIPNDRSNFREILTVEPHFGIPPSSHRSLDNMYIIMGRGWNNMYHHSEWSIQLIRYIFFSSSYPPMNNIALFPNIDFMNHHTHDRKGHYRYGRAYQDLIMDTFKADINGDDRSPHYIEHDEYNKTDNIICAKQAIIVPIITDMIKCFIDKREAYQIRLLAYKRYHAPLPLSSPSKLHLRFVDRSTKDRGMSNQKEIIEILLHTDDTKLTIQVNQQLSFSEQVISMFPIDIMVSVHGAGLTNIIFMLPFSGLIEIFPPLFFEPYYRTISRNSDLIYRSIRYSKIVNKQEYRYIRSKLDLTNKVFFVPPLNFTIDLNDVVMKVRQQKYAMVKCVKS